MVVLKPGQEAALEAMHNGCVLNGDVGSGKTYTSLAYYVKVVCKGDLEREEPMRRPRNLVVITPAKKRETLDWQSHAKDFGIFENGENSYGGVTIIVDSWNNLHKYDDLEDHFFIFDEQKVVGAGAWVKSFLKVCKNNEWVLLSATPADVWMDYLPLFVANGFYRNRTEFIENHVIWTFNGSYRKIKGFYNVSQLKYYRDQILVPIADNRHTKRHVVEVMCAYDKDVFDMVWKRKWNVIDDVPLLDTNEQYRIARRVVACDPDRLAKLSEFTQKRKKLIVFYNFDYELDILRDWAQAYGEARAEEGVTFGVAEWNGHKHEPVEDLYENEQWIYLVQYLAGAEAWECTETDSELFFSLNYSHRVFEQCQGRTDRPHKTPYTDLYYYVLMSDSKIDSLIWKKVKDKKNFHEGRNIKLAA